MEARIIRTCRPFLAIALLPLVLAGAAGEARASKGPLSPLGGYVQARAADAGGRAEEAAAGYAVALDASPDDAVLAMRAFRQAMAAGDERLALRAALVLDRSKVLPGDGRFLLMVDAVRRGDWGGAQAQVDRIESEGMFGFLVPVMRAWIAQGSGTGDPMAYLDGKRGSALASAYAADHRPLLLLVRGNAVEAVAAARATALVGGNRGVALRLALAARLADRGDRDRALTLVSGNDPGLAIARSRIGAGKSIPGAVDTAAEGLSALLARMASDITRERLPLLSISLARSALLLAPDSSAAIIAMGEALSGGGYEEAALDLLARIGADDPWSPNAVAARIALLQGAGDHAGALAEAEAVAARPTAQANDHARVGEVKAQAGDHAGAAAAYGRAIATIEAQKGAVPWSLWLLQGAAFERAGDWSRARDALRKAAVLAPDNATVLNHLGYAQLERGENIEEAMRLVARASAMRPEDAAIADSLGWAYYLRGDLPKAIEALERAVKGEPAEPVINEHLGDAYWAAGRRFEARYAWRSALLFAEGEAVERLRGKIDVGPSEGRPRVAQPRP